MALEQRSSPGRARLISTGPFAVPGSPASGWRLRTQRPAEQRGTESLQSPSPPRIVDEPLFTTALIRERKRAERVDQPFVLLLVRLQEATVERASILSRTVAALTAAKRESDLLGWLEVDAAIGLILADCGAGDPVALRSIEARFRRELTKYLSAVVLAKLTIRLYVHPDMKTSEGQDPADHPLLRRIEPGQDQRPLRDPIKRGLDIVGSLGLLIALAPVLLVIAAMVKLKSPGPVFFRQARIGQMMRPFMLLKFRTMHVNADHAIHHQFVTQFITTSPGQANAAGKEAFYKIADDPRVTRVGRFLRRTSLDELPQLWNVLRGDMSLVGPRPPLQYEVDQYKSWHCRRVLEAKPGLTGLWQVTGRSRTTFDEMVRLDLRYARMCSLWTDIKILLATPFAVFTGKGAC